MVMTTAPGSATLITPSAWRSLMRRPSPSWRGDWMRMTTRPVCRVVGLAPAPPWRSTAPSWTAPYVHLVDQEPFDETEVSTPLRGRRLLVAVSGSIAAVKTPLLVSAC